MRFCPEPRSVLAMRVQGDPLERLAASLDSISRGSNELLGDSLRSYQLLGQPPACRLPATARPSLVAPPPAVSGVAALRDRPGRSPLLPFPLDHSAPSFAHTDPIRRSCFASP